MTTVFLTGGTGFIGSHLAEALVARGHHVRALVRSDPKWLAGTKVEVVKGDLSDPEVLWKALDGVEYVYHVAGVTRATDDAAFEAGNVRATLNLLGAVKMAAPGVKKVMITSSLAAVGTCAGGVATEETPLTPISRYGASKARMEAALREKHDLTESYAEALPLVVVRPPAVYGPREADIYTFFQTLAKGFCPVVGDPAAPALSLVHSRDLVRGMIEATEAPNTAGETYFVGSEKAYSWADVRDAAAHALGRKVITIKIPEKLVVPIGRLAEWGGNLIGQYPALNREKALEIRDACKICSVEKAQQDFGYTQHVALDDGIAETITWYRKKGWL